MINCVIQNTKGEYFLYFDHNNEEVWDKDVKKVHCRLDRGQANIRKMLFEANGTKVKVVEVEVPSIAEIRIKSTDLAAVI